MSHSLFMSTNLEVIYSTLLVHSFLWIISFSSNVIPDTFSNWFDIFCSFMLPLQCFCSLWAGIMPRAAGWWVIALWVLLLFDCFIIRLEHFMILAYRDDFWPYSGLFRYWLIENHHRPLGIAISLCPPWIYTAVYPHYLAWAQLFII